MPLPADVYQTRGEGFAGFHKRGFLLHVVRNLPYLILAIIKFINANPCFHVAYILYASIYIVFGFVFNFIFGFSFECG